MCMCSCTTIICTRQKSHLKFLLNAPCSWGYGGTTPPLIDVIFFSIATLGYAEKLHSWNAEYQYITLKNIPISLVILSCINADWRLNIMRIFLVSFLRRKSFPNKIR